METPDKAGMNDFFAFRAFAPIIAAGYVGLIVLLTVMIGFQYAMLIAVGGLAVAMLVGQPRVLIAVYWLWTAVYPLVSYNINIPLLTYVDEMLVFVILLVFSAHCILDKPNLTSERTYMRVCMLVVVIGLVSAYVHEVPKLNVIHFYLQYFRFPILFLHSVLFLRERDAKTVYLILLGVFWLQFALNAGWLLHINPLFNHARIFDDFAIGSMDACNLVAYFTIATLLVVFARYTSTRRPGRRVALCFVSLCMLLNLYYTFTSHANYLLVVGLLVQIFFVQRNSWLRRLQYVAVGCVVILFIGFASSLVAASDESQDSSHDDSIAVLKDRWVRMIDGPKGQAYKDVLVSAASDVPYYYALGAGPGNFSTMVARMYRRPLADKYINYPLLAVDVLDITQGFSITSGPNTAIVAVLGDLGIPGGILFISLFFMAGVRVWKQYRADMYKDPWQRILAEAFVPTLVVFGLLCLVVDYLYLAYVSGGIWIWAGAVWKARAPAPDAVAPAIAKPDPSARRTLATRRAIATG